MSWQVTLFYTLPIQAVPADPYGEGNVTWTSNLTGVATVFGNVWYTGVISGRSVDWTLSLNTTKLDDGTVFYNDGYPRSNPITFGDFIFGVNPGDVVAFGAVRTSWFGAVLDRGQSNHRCEYSSPGSLASFVVVVWRRLNGVANI